MSAIVSYILKNKGYIAIYAYMENEHPWNFSIAQKVLYSGKRFFIKMVFKQKVLGWAEWF